MWFWTWKLRGGLTRWIDVRKIKTGSRLIFCMIFSRLGQSVARCLSEGCSECVGFGVCENVCSLRGSEM